MCLTIRASSLTLEGHRHYTWLQYIYYPRNGDRYNKTPYDGLSKR